MAPSTFRYQKIDRKYYLFSVFRKIFDLLVIVTFQIAIYMKNDHNVLNDDGSDLFLILFDEA